MRLQLVLSCFVILSFSSAASSQDRAGTREFALFLIGNSPMSTMGHQGASLDVDEGIGWGFSSAFNFTNRLAVGVEISTTNTDYTATRILEDTGEAETISTDLDFVNIHTKGVFHFLEGPLTPFVEAGIGWTQFDSNVVEWESTVGCWWDPWWGYICRTVSSTYKETETSYSVGVGLRWEIAQDFMLKGTVSTVEVDRGGRTEDASLDTLRFDVLWRF